MDITKNWYKYGEDARGVDKMVQVDEERILHFAGHEGASMPTSMFIKLVEMREDIPVTDEAHTDEIPVGEYGNETVSLSRTINGQAGPEEKLGMSFRYGGKWSGWIKFNLEELTEVLNIITETSKK